MATSFPEKNTIFNGLDPAVFQISDPFRIFAIQLLVITGLCRLLQWPLSKIRQPRVIAEIIGGIILGPTALGKIDRFKNKIFPDESLVLLQLTSTVGLVLFLFVIGMEVDLRIVRRYAKLSISVAIASIIFPFAIGIAIASRIWHVFMEEKKASLPNTSYGLFLLYIGTSVSVTALPVLARILTELKILNNKVGAVALAAGVANDVTAWILLALCLSLSSSTKPLVVLYMLLSIFGLILFWRFGLSPILLRMASSNRNSQISEVFVWISLSLVIASSFFTDIVGIHAIFGGFLAGLMIPKERSISLQLTEKIEDLIQVLFLPLYFANSGLKTDLTQLNDGKSWAYTILIIFCAFISKFVPSAIASKLFGMELRESLSLGVLMSCKGLVELIVLNTGLSAGIISQKVFSMFVFEALVLTLLTTPLTSIFYSKSYQNSINQKRFDDDNSCNEQDTKSIRSLVVFTDEKIVIDALPYVHFILNANLKIVNISCLRLIELSERTSDVIKIEQQSVSKMTDVALDFFSAFLELNSINHQSIIRRENEVSFHESVLNILAVENCNTVILPFQFDNMYEGTASHYYNIHYAVFFKKIRSCLNGNNGILLLRNENEKTNSTRATNDESFDSKKRFSQDLHCLLLLCATHENEKMLQAILNYSKMLNFALSIYILDAKSTPGASTFNRLDTIKFAGETLKSFFNGSSSEIISSSTKATDSENVMAITDEERKKGILKQLNNFARSDEAPEIKFSFCASYTEIQKEIDLEMNHKSSASYLTIMTNNFFSELEESTRYEKESHKIRNPVMLGVTKGDFLILNGY